jgi:hypothetical protein
MVPEERNIRGTGNSLYFIMSLTLCMAVHFNII